MEHRLPASGTGSAGRPLSFPPNVPPSASGARWAKIHQLWQERYGEEESKRKYTTKSEARAAEKRKAKQIGFIVGELFPAPPPTEDDNSNIFVQCGLARCKAALRERPPDVQERLLQIMKDHNTPGISDWAEEFAKERLQHQVGEVERAFPHLDIR